MKTLRAGETAIMVRTLGKAVAARIAVVGATANGKLPRCAAQ